MNKRILNLTILLAFLSQTAGWAALRHQYTFNQPPGETSVVDSVGNANGTISGAAQFTTDGQIEFSGSNGYVDLPNGIISALTDATFETWVTFSGTGGAWQRVWDFGSNSAGEDAQGTGQTYVFLTPRVGTDGTVRFAATLASGGGEGPVLNGTASLPAGQQVHVVVTYSFTANEAVLYLDGQAVATGPTAFPLTDLDDVNNWLGRSNWPDAYFSGRINEFRIYDTALTAAEVSANTAAGPTAGAPDLGAVQSLTLSLESNEVVQGTTVEPVAIADFASVQDVDVSNESDLELTSSNPSVLAVTASNGLRGVAVGSATVTANFRGQTATLSVTVVPVPLPEAELRHRYSFSETSGSVTVEDSAGDADGELVGFSGDFTGNGQLDLFTFGDPASATYVNLPNGIISALTNATIEMWVTFDGEPGAWQRIFDFGSNSGGEDVQGTGQTYLFVTPRVGTTGPLRFAITTSSGGGESPVLEGPATLPVGEESHVVLTYNWAGRVAKLYLNGQLVDEGAVSIPLSSIDDVNNWLGQSNWPDAPFDGQFNEFRIYEGILTDFQIALSAAAGPDVLGANPGEFQNISIEIADSELFVGGFGGQATVLANFGSIQGVNVSTQQGISYESSDPNVVAVNGLGELNPLGVGSATITARFQGQEASAQVSVVRAPGDIEEPRLLHRYSFDEAPGQVVANDSVGSAHGSLFGSADFTGEGSINLDPIEAGYVDLPDGMISALPDAVTFETWVTWNGGAVWQRIWDFGSNTGGPDGQGTGETYMFLSPQGGPGQARFTVTLNSGAGETPVLNSSSGPLPTGELQHLVVTYNVPAGAARLYVNGEQTAVGPASITPGELNDYNNWIGRSNWPDPGFNGQIHEFRIWEGALTPAEVRNRFLAGPDSLEAPAQPAELAIARDASGIVISWPESAAAARLQTASALGANTTWTDYTGQVTTGNGQRRAVIAPTEDAQFFRLTQ